MVVPKEITLVVDTHEKKGPLFPSAFRVKLPGRSPSYVKINIVHKTLPTGDYLLQENPDCIVERKGSVDELAKNFLSADKYRASKAFGRLLQTPYPILLLDMSLGDAFYATKGAETPEEVLDALFMFCTKYSHLRVYMVPPGKTPTSRRRTGEFLVRLLFHQYIRKINESYLHSTELGGRLSGDNGQLH